MYRCIDLLGNMEWPAALVHVRQGTASSTQDPAPYRYFQPAIPISTPQTLFPVFLHSHVHQPQAAITYTALCLSAFSFPSSQAFNQIAFHQIAFHQIAFHQIAFHQIAFHQIAWSAKPSLSLYWTILSSHYR
ncbi:hypothetical protein VC83_04666 [Pseudogymnoascus destructans]|uniref:Uncharacterized protein n=1 Tax=Pseudogymnoascus destructans TaxID=655981 RepID=A0A177A578_9PEZI|nr:uncharacterized protein VC83_04666 [Pseudogymnoascus destructans]OAF57267.1 hypothetical protein VC83_04666 [Pseudogymnoascus destructans]